MTVFGLEFWLSYRFDRHCNLNKGYLKLSRVVSFRFISFHYVSLTFRCFSLLFVAFRLRFDSFRFVTFLFV
jgi:hypothetical protein